MMREGRRDNRRSQSRSSHRGDRNERKFDDGHSSGRSFNSGPRRNFNSGPREMHKAICAECNKQCDVPFKPVEGKPVYCRDCFSKRRERF